MDEQSAVDIDEQARSYIKEQEHQVCSSIVSHSEATIGDGQAGACISDNLDIINARKCLTNGCGCRSNCISSSKEDTIYSHILNITNEYGGKGPVYHGHTESE